jgi:hypothetical protein
VIRGAALLLCITGSVPLSRFLLPLLSLSPFLSIDGDSTWLRSSLLSTFLSIQGFSVVKKQEFPSRSFQTKQIL